MPSIKIGLQLGKSNKNRGKSFVWHRDEEAWEKQLEASTKRMKMMQGKKPFESAVFTVMGYASYVEYGGMLNLYGTKVKTPEYAMVRKSMPDINAHLKHQLALASKGAGFEWSPEKIIAPLNRTAEFAHKIIKDKTPRLGANPLAKYPNMTGSEIEQRQLRPYNEWLVPTDTLWQSWTIRYATGV